MMKLFLGAPVLIALSFASTSMAGKNDSGRFTPIGGIGSGGGGRATGASQVTGSNQDVSSLAQQVVLETGCHEFSDSALEAVRMLTWIRESGILGKSLDDVQQLSASKLGRLRTSIGTLCTSGAFHLDLTITDDSGQPLIAKASGSDILWNPTEWAPEAIISRHHCTLAKNGSIKEAVNCVENVRRTEALTQVRAVQASGDPVLENLPAAKIPDVSADPLVVQDEPSK